MIQDERYLLSLLRYLHQNPTQAGMCRNTEDYKWSSDIFYRTNDNTFVAIDIILDMVASGREAAIDKYKEYMKQEEEKDYDNMKIVGDEAYQMLRSNKKQVEERKRLEEILIDQGMSQEQYELIKSGSRRRDLIEYKINYAREAIRLKYTHKEIGKSINISDTAIRKLIKRA